MPNAMRSRAVIPLAASAFAVALCGPAAAERIHARESVSVMGTMVTLGDIFRNVPPRKADRDVMRAPAPGQTRNLDTDTLAAIADQNDLTWRAPESGTGTEVRRESHEVPRKRIKAAVGRALAQYDVDDDMNIVLSSPNIDLVLPANVPATVKLEDFTYRRNANRFSARARAPAKGASQAQTTIRGEVRRMVEVPVLNRRIDRDERVRKDDIKWVQRPESELRSSTITNAQKLVGNIARRPLSANEMLRDTAVEEPILVERRSLVTLKLQTGGMNLTAKGQALEDGTMDDTVRVENVKSERVVTGVVTAPGVVQVQPNSAPTN